MVVPGCNTSPSRFFVVYAAVSKSAKTCCIYFLYLSHKHFRSLPAFILGYFSFRSTETHHSCRNICYCLGRISKGLQLCQVIFIQRIQSLSSCMQGRLGFLQLFFALLLLLCNFSSNDSNLQKNKHQDLIVYINQRVAAWDGYCDGKF